MQLPNSLTRRRSPLELQMTPLIDVVFLLLVFFVWTASFQAPERWLPGTVSVPAKNQTLGNLASDEPPPPEDDFDQVIVRIRWRDDRPLWTINDQTVAGLDAVQSHLSRIAQITTVAPVVLHPDAQVPLGIVIDAYDSARLAGFTRVNFAVPK